MLVVLLKSEERAATSCQSPRNLLVAVPFNLVNVLATEYNKLDIFVPF